MSDKSQSMYILILRKSLILSIAESRTESRTVSYRRKSTWCGWASLPALLLPSPWSWRWSVWNIISWFVLISFSIGPKADHYLPSSINDSLMLCLETWMMWLWSRVVPAAWWIWCHNSYEGLVKVLEVQAMMLKGTENKPNQAKQDQTIHIKKTIENLANITKQTKPNRPKKTLQTKLWIVDWLETLMKAYIWTQCLGPLCLW